MRKPGSFAVYQAIGSPKSVQVPSKVALSTWEEGCCFLTSTVANVAQVVSGGKGAHGYRAHKLPLSRAVLTFRSRPRLPVQHTSSRIKVVVKASAVTDSVHKFCSHYHSRSRVWRCCHIWYFRTFTLGLAVIKESYKYAYISLH